jgi:hypothetical protein
MTKLNVLTLFFLNFMNISNTWITSSTLLGFGLELIKWFGNSIHVNTFVKTCTYNIHFLH